MFLNLLMSNKQTFRKFLLKWSKNVHSTCFSVKLVSTAHFKSKSPLKDGALRMRNTDVGSQDKRLGFKSSKVNFPCTLNPKLHCKLALKYWNKEREEKKKEEKKRCCSVRITTMNCTDSLPVTKNTPVSVGLEAFMKFHTSTLWEEELLWLSITSLFYNNLYHIADIKVTIHFPFPFTVSLKQSLKSTAITSTEAAPASFQSGAEVVMWNSFSDHSSFQIFKQCL